MEKVLLPIKTKIAAWWMIVIGIFELIWGYLTVVIMYAAEYQREKAPFVLGVGIFTGILLIISSLLLFKQKKAGWKLAIIFFLVLLISIILIIPAELKISKASIYGRPPPWSILISLPILVDVIEILYIFFAPLHSLVSFIPFILFLIPLILLLLDRKNFWKIAS